MNLEDAAERAVNVFLWVKKGENVLIITDKEKKKIGEALAKASRKVTPHAELIEVDISGFRGMEPPAEAAEKMKKSDVVFAPLSVSLSHTKARQDACASGARIVTMPGITENMFRRGIEVDPEKLVQRTNAIADILDRGSEVLVESEAGTYLRFSINGRTAWRTTGINREKGFFSNLPGGEAFIAPVEGTANGIHVVDGSILGQKVGFPIKITVEDGKAVGFEGGELAERLDQTVQSAKARGRNIAEFGIGTNDRSRISGNVLEDEKVLGTVHIALGNNIRIGGKTDANIHVDGVILKPSFSVDGKKIMEKGKLLL
ncbi:aminopeptidase [Candidatus Woesearchaeota archaeon]|nr:aminopeptidase [Candidatus Woesearchaeota archaeon]